jgi:hypothetical protein
MNSNDGHPIGSELLSQFGACHRLARLALTALAIVALELAMNF